MGNKVLLTGGTGSFGQKFVEVALKECDYDVIRIYSRSEFLQDEMRKKFNDDRLRFFIGDVRDKSRLYRAMGDVDIVVHAAALKQIPACEYNPIEAVNTNILGSVNVIDNAIDSGIKKVVAIGSDKEAHPVNLYGATKLVAEKLFIQANAYAGKKETGFSCVRYGNVFGSRGSVLPLFLKQKESGVLTITDERMTRFWLTLEQGVRFVISCLDKMQGGEVFVPKIPSMKVVDIANVVSPDSKKNIIGLRPGEKLHETLVTEDECRHTLENGDYFVIIPEFAFWGERNYQDGGVLTQRIRYASDNNTWWLTKEELKNIIDKVEIET